MKLLFGAILGVLATLGAFELAGITNFQDNHFQPNSSKTAKAPKPLSEPESDGKPNSSALSQDIDTLFASAWPVDEPGVAVIVARGDEIILSKGYGLADIEQNVPVNPSTVFRLASITKQFSAVSILLLEQDGLLKLTDDIQTHLPDYPTHGKVITVEHLLTHTSGIPNYTDFENFAATMRTDHNTSELLALFQDKDLDFKPGDAYNYSNSGYIVVGAIIEAVSGQSYEQFVTERIFEPLDMTASYYGSHAKIIANRAKGYTQAEDGYVNAPYLSMTIPHAAGALMSTVEDMIKWNRGLLRGELLPLETLEKAWTPAVLNNGEPSGYGYGWGIGAYKGSRVITHNGGINGFGTDGIVLPDEEIVVVVLSNNDSTGEHSRLARMAASNTLGKPIPLPEDSIDLPSELLEAYAGSYQASPADQRVISIVDGGLASKRGDGPVFPLNFYSDTEFVFEGSTTLGRFDRDETGNVMGMTTMPWAQGEQFAPRVEESPEQAS